MIKTVCVYCGSSLGNLPVYKEAAEALGKALAAADIGLVYGGGGVGLMGAVADAVMANGGRAVGIIPQLLLDKEVGHRGLTELHVVPDMHKRKQMMADLADAFITMPGGAGTLEELFEVYTWAQLGYHNKPIGLLNVAGFYNPLMAMLQHTADAGFIRAPYLDLLMSEAVPETLVKRLQDHEPVLIDKWAKGRNAI